MAVASSREARSRKAGVRERMREGAQLRRRSRVDAMGATLPSPLCPPARLWRRHRLDRRALRGPLHGGEFERGCHPRGAWARRVDLGSNCRIFDRAAGFSLPGARLARACRRRHRLAFAGDSEASGALVANLVAPAHRRAALDHRRLRRAGGDSVRLLRAARILFGAGAEPVAALVAGGKPRDRRRRHLRALCSRGSGDGAHPVAGRARRNAVGPRTPRPGAHRPCGRIPVALSLASAHGGCARRRCCCARLSRQPADRQPDRA